MGILKKRIDSGDSGAENSSDYTYKDGVLSCFDMGSFSSRLPEILEIEYITTTNITGLKLYGCKGITLGDGPWSTLEELVIDMYSEEPDNTLLGQIGTMGLSYNKLKTLVLDSLVSCSKGYFLFDPFDSGGGWLGHESDWKTCTSLTTASFAKLETIGIGFLAFCTGLTSISLPALRKYTSGEDGPLYWCSKLTELSFPELTTIDGNLFLYGCTGLRSLTFGKAIEGKEGRPANFSFGNVPTTLIALHLCTAEYSSASGNEWRGKTWKSIDTNI